MEVCQHMETNNTEMNTLLHLIICFPPFGNCSFGLLPCRIPPSGIPPSGMIPVICDRSQKCSFSCIPKEFNFHGGKSTNLFIFPVRKVSK